MTDLLAAECPWKVAVSLESSIIDLGFQAGLGIEVSGPRDGTVAELDWCLHRYFSCWCPVSGVLLVHGALVICPTRLETRTKESNMCTSQVVWKPNGEVKARMQDPLHGVHCWPPYPSLQGWVEQECTCWDPKDGELCLSRVKPEETLVEARSGSDVQIDHQTWV